MLLQAGVCLAVALGFARFREIGAHAFNRVTHQVARYSYGIYLFHMPAIWLGFFRLPSDSLLVAGLTSLALTIVFAVAAHHLIEAPAIAWSRRALRSFSARSSAA